MARPDDAGELETALTSPSALTSQALEAVVARLDAVDVTGWAASLAAILYARPDLAAPELADRLAALLRTDRVTEPAVHAAATIFETLATTELAPSALTALVGTLRGTRLSPASRARLMLILRAYASWCPELLDVQTLVDLAARPTLRAHHDALLGHLLEPLLARAPGRVTDGDLDRIRAVFDGCPRLPYTLHAVGDRAGTRAAVRRRVAGLTQGSFPERGAARAVLGRRPFALLVVLNVRIGQGDEIVRLVALLQALLDANPALRVAVLTTRSYLYDHPRVRPVSILDPVAVDAALAGAYQGVIHVFEPGWPEVAWHPPLDARVRELVVAQRPPFLVTADVGHNHFVYRSVELDGRDIAAERGLDRLTVDNIYDGCHRLLAELGLPERVAEDPPGGPGLLTGIRCPDAERTWADLTTPLTTPIALVNPYGGKQRIKGYLPDRPDPLAAELTGLVADGYSAVLLSNGTPWGSREAAEAVLARLPPSVRRRVVVGPDPAEAQPARQVPLTVRPELPYADRVMRLLKYFTASADLVVTVEGWLAHLAYALARPFRLVLRAQSGSFDWHPSPRGLRQRLVTGFSPPGSRATPEVLGPDDPPPLPPRDRKPLLLTALRGLGQLDRDRAIPILLRALTSEDHEVRAAAVAVLGDFLPTEPARRLVLGGLRDREPLVRRAAAEALLASGADFAAELGPRFGQHLAAHRDIARQDWAAVQRLGPTALPALFTAADGENDPVRREARWVVAGILAESRGPRPGPHVPTTRRLDDFDRWFKSGFYHRLGVRRRTFYLALMLAAARHAKTIVETGTTRQAGNWVFDGQSTCVLGAFARRYGAKLWTCDVDESHVATARRATAEFAPHIEYVVSDSVRFLQSFHQPIDLLYLDSFDFDPGDPGPPQDHALREGQAALHALHGRSIVLIDDCRVLHGGKGGKVIPFLIDAGWRVVRAGYQTLLTRSG